MNNVKDEKGLESLTYLRTSQGVLDYDKIVELTKISL
jgi:hypothetical protein